MTAEIICVGTELLLGDIVNTNAQFLSRELAELGISVLHQHVIGDNPARLKELVLQAKSRSDLLVFSGGLGPTEDDLTKETVAEAFGDTLAFDEAEWQKILDFFARTNRRPTENNRKQAMCPTIVPLMRETKREQDIYFTSLIDTMKILVATEKPFAKKAVDGIRGIVENAGYELALLEKYTDKGQLLEAVADVDALIVRSDKVTAEVIAAAKNLKIVVRAGAGYDNVDLAAASARGIVVMNTPGQNSNAVAELALAMMIFMSRNRFTPGTGMELQGKTLGIHAYGNVGRLVGRKGKALGMNVVAYDPFIADGAVFEADGVKKVASVEELYRVSDFLSLHIPATAQTKGSIGYDLMMSMPKGATLVNTARKEVIDEEGVARAMTEREDLKYITDIAAGNQAELDEKFGKRVFATAKKMGAETAEANVNAGLAAANQIVDFLKNGNTRFQVNK